MTRAGLGRSAAVASRCLVLLTLAGCAGAKTKDPVVSTSGNGKTTTESGTVAAQRGKSLVRFVNAVPDQSLDLTTEDRATFITVGYKTVTPYTEIGDNLVKFKLRASDGDSTLAENNETLGDGFRYTVVAMPTDDHKIIIHVLRDELVPDSGKARIRVIQATPGLSDVDLAMAGQKDPLFDNVKYGTEAGFKDVAPASAVLEARVGDPPHVTVPLRIKSMRLDAGKAYTIVILGADPRHIEAITFNDAVRVAALHP